jgi:hypothetical protein
MSEITRNEYYNLLIDSREIFTGYGRYLQEKGIKNDTIEEYENYLYNKEQQEATENSIYVCQRLNNNTPDKDSEYTEFLCWILEKTEWDNEITIIRQEEWDRFWNSDIEDDEMDMGIVYASDFYNEFERLVGIEDFDECFVHMKYIDELQNSISLIVNVNGKDERFRVDVL